MKRRLFLASALIAGGGYSLWRGLRFPRLGFAPRPNAAELTISNAELKLNSFSALIIEGKFAGLRAQSLQPALQVKLDENDITLKIENISTLAKLTLNATSTASVNEEKQGLVRYLSLSSSKPETVRLSWQMPVRDNYSFAVIGDTGGGEELHWCLQRAHQLGADFLLHLGDFNYNDGEYDAAISAFNQSSVPVFVAIGNHDYNDNGLVYPQFLNQIGPLNNQFTFLGTRFILFDTSASFFPISRGQRGNFFRQLAKLPVASSTLAFTHKPFIDIRDDKDHEISDNEKSWLLSVLQRLAVSDLFCGHVHRSGETKLDNFTQWTVGEGLAFEDIRNEQKVARILMGHLNKNQPPQFKWQPLDMPWTMQTSPSQQEKIIKELGESSWRFYRKKVFREITAGITNQM